MPNFNKVFLMGNLTKDPELRYTAASKAVVNLRMATNRTWKDSVGNKQEEATFYTVVVWNKQAESSAELLKKGDPVFVEGRLQSRTWEKEDKTKVSILEVVAERVQFLKQGKKDEDVVPEVIAEQPAPIEEDIPF